MVLEDENEFTHSRIPAHEFRDAARMFELELDREFDVFLKQSLLPMAVRSYMLMMSDCSMSYDQYSHLYKFYELHIGSILLIHSFLPMDMR